MTNDLRTSRWQIFLALLLAAGASFLAWWFSTAAGWGRTAGFVWVAGLAFGFVLQRSRFCFFCNIRDFVCSRQAGGVLGLLTALAVGLVGSHVLLGAWIPDPTAGHLPPKAHIGAVGWHLVLGGLAFGVGMSLSGSCVSAHLYRLGEGSLVCLFALAGIFGGFLLGWMTWNPLYLALIQEAPTWWLPRYLHFPGALIAQLAALVLLLLWVLKLGKKTAPASDLAEDKSPANATKEYQTVQSSFWTPLEDAFAMRWPTWVGGAIIGALGVALLLRADPLGVTAEMSRLARVLGSALGWLPERLEGVDALRGCASRPASGAFTDGALLVLGLVLGSAISSLGGREFSWEWPNLRSIAGALVGGIFLGWGATLAAGCTVGTLLSGIQVSALSGWVFGICMLIGLLLALPIRTRWIAASKG